MSIVRGLRLIPRASRQCPSSSISSPWGAKTIVLPFPGTPGPEPEVPQRAASVEELLDSFDKREKAARAHALWKISGITSQYRALGVKRVFGSYDGGGDEGFTHLHGIQMSDGRVIGADALRTKEKGVDYEQLVEDAVSGLLGRFDAGEFVLRGAVIIDFDACTITDEKDADVVFGDKVVWSI